jgi:hypothetical protein
MKRSTLASSLAGFAAATLMQTALGQALDANPPEAGPIQQPAAPSPLEEAPMSPKPERFIAPVTQVQPASAAPELSIQEQLRWAEQRAAAAEEEARSAQRNLPFLILLVLFALPVAFAGGVFYARYKNYQQLNKTLRGLMENGVTIPPELLTPMSATVPPISDFRKGLLFICTGIGAVFLLGISLTGSRAWSLGLIPIFTGLAYLVLWKLEQRKESA